MAGRSPATIVLTVGSVLVGLYCQFAAVALLVTGSVFASGGSGAAQAALLVGLLFLVLTVAAYAVVYGLWAGRGWAWAGSIVVFSALIAASVLLTLISTNIPSAVGPTIGASAALWYLIRPGTKAQLLHPDPAAYGRAKALTSPGSMEASQLTR